MEKQYESRLYGPGQAARPIKGPSPSKIIIDELPDLICCFKPEGTITFANQSYCNFTNKDIDQLIGSSIFSPLTRKDSESLKEYIGSLSKVSPVNKIDYWALGPDGQRHWQRWTMRGIFDDQGNILELISSGRDISDIKNIEEMLIETLEKYSAIFESSHDAIILLDDENIIDCNNAAVRMFGYINKASLINKSYNIILPTSEKDHTKKTQTVSNYIASALRRKGVKFQWICQRADGSTFPADIVINCCNIEGKQIIATSVRDISDEKRYERSLKNSEEKYRELVENINDAIFTLDDKGNILYTSPMIKKITGYSPSELLGKNFSELIYSKDLPSVVKRFSDLIKGTIIPYEYRIIRKNGSTCWIRTYSRLVKEDDEPRIFGLVTDINKMRKAEDSLQTAYERLEDIVGKRTAELRSSNKNLKKEIKKRLKIEDKLLKNEKQYRMMAEELYVVLNGISDNITLQDSDLNIIWANSAVSASSGIRSKDLTGKKCYKLLKNRETPCEDCPVLNSIQSGQHHETIQESPDGRLFETRSYPVKDEYGTIRGAIEISRDVTQSKLLESEIIKGQKLESLGNLAGGIAHDFNNLLTVILGNVTFAKMLTIGGDKIVKRLDDIEEASHKAKDLANQLLTFSKGGNPLKKKIVINNFLKEIVTLSTHKLDLTPVFFIPDDLWMVEIDEAQISQVINNIIVNAHQSMPEGGSVKVHAENMYISAKEGLPLKEGIYIKISINDSGTGIEKGVIEHIFDPFFTTKPRGYGLGLSTSYSIIKRHGGYINADSHPGKGTSIILYLPAHKQEEKVSDEDIEQTYIGHGSILFMDDEAYIRKLARSILSHLGYKVTFAKNGKEAIKKYKASMSKGKNFDAVILDLTVPEGMGGMECIKELRKLDPQVKAIVSSGYSNDPVMSEPQKYGFRDYIPKPYIIQNLSRTLKKTINGQ